LAAVTPKLSAEMDPPMISCSIPGCGECSSLRQYCPWLPN
jgi:hypothetical protein